LLTDGCCKSLELRIGYLILLLIILLVIELVKLLKKMAFIFKPLLPVVSIFACENTHSVALG